jgi:hypothetical protein
VRYAKKTTGAFEVFSVPYRTLAAQTAQRSVDNSFDRLPGLADRASMHVAEHEPDQGAIMAKRKKGSKVQGRAKLRRANSAKRNKTRKVAKAAKRAVAKAKPKPVPKKVARKVKQPVAPVVETVAAEVIEQPAAVTGEASASPPV